jgi:hypothetical protein
LGESDIVDTDTRGMECGLIHPQTRSQHV